jgi:hypothetical protein
MTNNSQRGIWIAAIIGVVVILLCMCIALFGLGGLALFGLSRTVTQQTVSTEITATSQPETFKAFPTATQLPKMETRIPDFSTATPEAGAKETLNTLQTAQIPFSDLRMQAMEFLDLSSIPETVAYPGEFAPGDEQAFWVLNSDTNRYSRVDTVLAYETPHLYFWIEKGLSYNKNALSRLCTEFEEKIYPTNREFFGSEWSPGVDGDDHLYIIYASDMGANLAGMFSSADSVNPLAYPYSNGHESFFLNADNAGLDEDFTYGVLAHEFQHMIHWYHDRNEETWLSEGFSVLASYLNGYDTGGFDYAFLMEPSTQLNYWPDNNASTAADYGASFLFVEYFLERFGENATQQLIDEQLNGLDSIDKILESLQVTAPDSNEPYRADDLFADWAIANAVNDTSLAEGQYGYDQYVMPFEISATDTLEDCLGGWQTGAVNQYGTHYIRLACNGQRTLQFEGASVVNLISEDAHSGDYAFWSNQGDESRMTLAQSFDLREVEGPVEMQYWTWYDIETDYDYLYLQASIDGTDWTLLDPPSCTDENPTGANYGCAYNGQSNGWIQETIDLSDYAGQQVWLRFVYLTDAAVNGEGLLLDDISIPAIGYQTDFETDDGGWQAEGFARIENILPQTFRLALILKGDETEVKILSWTPGETLAVPVDFDAYDEVTLVVSGTTRFTHQPGAYRIQVSR